MGPFFPHDCPFKELYFSPLFNVPKPDGTWRTVAHLSYPSWGTSVNDCIPEEAKHVSYISFPELAEFIYKLGYDARLWVVDAKDAYYRIPVRKSYWKYMAIKWMGLVFVFTCLQMGLGSACAIYQRFADAILFIIRNNSSKLFWHAGAGIYCIHHYLDDFFGGHPDPSIALQQMEATYDWFYRLGIPTRLKKLKFPHWLQIILGWLWNTRARTVSLPDYKVRLYTAHVTRLIREQQKGTDKKELEKLNGELGHTSEVIYCGKAKQRNIEHALHLEAKDYHTKIYLDELAIINLKWWLFAFKHLNGIPLTWIFSNPKEYHEIIWTDAALLQDTITGGMGGFTKSGLAFQLSISQTLASTVAKVRSGLDIKLFETLAVYVMIKLLAPQLRYKNIRIYCDNSTTVSSVVKKRGPLNRRDIHYIIDKICMLAVEYRFRFWIDIIEGKKNILADRLSRFEPLVPAHGMDPTKLKYFKFEELVVIVNQVFEDMLDFKKVPKNTSKNDEF